MTQALKLLFSEAVQDRRCVALLQAATDDNLWHITGLNKASVGCMYAHAEAAFSLLLSTSAPVHFGYSWSQVLLPSKLQFLDHLQHHVEHMKSTSHKSSAQTVGVTKLSCQSVSKDILL